MRDDLPYTTPLGAYDAEAEALLAALKAGDDDARWRFKWAHPRYRGEKVEAVDPGALDLSDARLVVAHGYAFESWADLAAFAADEGPKPFEAAADAIVAGKLATLRTMLQADPALARARSTRRHRATLLHYIAANGVEGYRQKTPPNAVEIARVLLESGAEVDALADMYEQKCTTMSMLVSSSPPHAAGLQFALAEALLDHGAAYRGPGTEWQSAVLTALAFGFLDTAQAFVRRGAPVESLAAAAGLGRVGDAARLLPQAGEEERHVALALAAQHGHAEIVTLLLEAGEDPDRYNPPKFHAHSTPLHQAVWADHEGVVRLLIARGARLDLRDTIFDGTPLGWALHGKKDEMAEILRRAGAQE
ncbi:MAG TPA: ankyrin repeat domain-containing protein [Candidatus Polarisedimenticolaceae bacterium]|nr:ankyrin repeat domain-containing protein [Candidatus Polarisedimenticolaceae bacterium]